MTKIRPKSRIYRTCRRIPGSVWRRPDAQTIASELTDGRFYYARVASVTDAGVQPVYSLRVDTADHAFITNGFVSHNTEARLTPLAMEMLREIDEETVDFIPNYDGRVQEPTVLPSRFPNLLANGSGGIAVGMATNMPPHNLRELGEAVFWCLENFEADEEATLAAVCERVKGPDFPTYGLIVGSQGISRHLHDRPRVDPHARCRARSKRTAGAAPASSSPNCRTRSTTTTSSPRSPSRFATPSWPASPTSRTSPVTGSACASSSSSSATPWPRWC